MWRESFHGIKISALISENLCDSCLHQNLELVSESKSYIKELMDDYIGKMKSLTIIFMLYAAVVVKTTEIAVASSSFQIEGATKEDGREPSIWDDFVLQKGAIADNSTADIACDFYHRWEEDLDLAKSLGAKAFRFSISWSRVFPSGEKNEKGVEFYRNVIAGCKERGMEPLVTMWHWDTPLEYYQREPKAWEDNDLMVEKFREYAEFLYETFGSEVKYWMTLNEPRTVTVVGYILGIHAPGRKERESDVPYKVAHGMLKAHEAAYKLYHEKFAAEQNGKVGIALNSDYFVPKTESEEDKEAANRAIVWFLGWFADPLLKGEYPPEMKSRLGDLLPDFGYNGDDFQPLMDYFALNHYTTNVAENKPSKMKAYFDGPQANTEEFPEGAEKSVSEWLRSYPEGINKLLHWIEDRYSIKEKNFEVIISEFGFSTSPGDIDDQSRVRYYDGYVKQILQARDELGLNMPYVCFWSLMDNFEWNGGYKERFGLVDVDFKSNLTRTLKSSAKWLMNEGKALFDQETD